MNRTRSLPSLFLVTAVAVSCLASPAWAGDFMDTRLTWVFGDDDVNQNAGEVVPDSPMPGIGDRPGYELFMDNLNTKTSGRENLTHIALYNKMDGFLKGVVTEAGLVVKLDLGALYADEDFDVKRFLMDDGSFLRLAWTWDEEDAERNQLAVTFFPFDTERFRLGHLYDISWGGGNIFSTRRSGPAPGFKVEARAMLHPDVQGYLYGGLKTAKVSQVVQLGAADAEEITVNEMNYGGLGGLGLDLFDQFAIDLGVGYFQQGTFNVNGLIGAKVYSIGLSGRLTYHYGMPIQTSIDYMLYRNDPNVNVMEWWHEDYVPGKLSASVSLEGTYLWQRLADSRKYATTAMQPAWAGALQFKMKYDYLRFQFVGLVRNLEFILQNVPSLTPFVALPDDNVDNKPEVFFAGTFDYYFEKLHLMPFITVGVQLPAAFRTLDDDGNLVSVQVIRDQTHRDRLPAGFDVNWRDWHSWVYQVRVGLQWDLSEFMSIIGNIQYVHDENMTRLVIDSHGERREFRRPYHLGFSILARARF